jgi:hypothetical protein
MKQKVKSNGRGVKTSVEFLSKVKTPTPVHSFVNIRDNSKGTGTYYERIWLYFWLLLEHICCACYKPLGRLLVIQVAQYRPQVTHC